MGFKAFTLGLGLGLLGRLSRLFRRTVSFNGLSMAPDANEARPGSHAGISVILPDDVTAWFSQSWGFGDNASAAQLGTGSSPADFTSAAGNTLRWQGVDQLGRVWTGSAPINYARPVALTSSIDLYFPEVPTEPYDMSQYVDTFGPVVYSTGREVPSRYSIDPTTGALSFTELAAGIRSQFNEFRVRDATDSRRSVVIPLNFQVAEPSVLAITETSDGELQVDNAEGNLTITVAAPDPHAGAYTTTVQGTTLTSALIESSGFVALAKPVITGETNLGSVLSATNGYWFRHLTSTVLSFSYQWFRNGVAIPGAISASYQRSLADEGKSLTCSVIASNGVTSITITSEPITIPSSQASVYAAGPGSITIVSLADRTPIVATAGVESIILTQEGDTVGNTQAGYRKVQVPELEFTDVTVTSNNQVISGLEPATQYEVTDYTGNPTQFVMTESLTTFGAEYVAGVTSASPAGDPTTITIPIGTADANRWPVVVIGGFLRGNTPNKVAGVTLNGEVCTVLSQAGAANGENRTCLIVRPTVKISTGTEATLVIDWVDGFQPNNAIPVRADVYRIISPNAPTLVAAPTVLNGSNVSVDVQVGDAIIAGVFTNNTADPATTWNGVTSRSSLDVATGEFAAVADDLNVAANATGRLIGNPVGGAMAVVVLRG